MKELNYSISLINQIVKGELHSSCDDDTIIYELLIDSRKLINANSSIFFALKSKRNDGHKYIKNLYKRGLRSFVVSEIPDQFEYLVNANYILVKDTLKALQALSAYHRLQMDYPVLAITGSNGKTIVKEWIYQVLQGDKSIHRSPKSYNSQIGVPLSVWQMKPHHEMAIIEAGISEPEEMNNLQKIIQPTIGIFTNIGEAHGENFINNTHKAGEKLKLFTKVDTLIYSPDQKRIQEVLIRSELLEQIKSFTWSMESYADVRITKVEKSQQHSTIKAIYKEKEISIEILFIDDASIENAIQVWCLLLLLGYEADVISEKMLGLAPIAMRLELNEGINNCSIINDSYNSDINSLKIALDFLEQQNQHQQNTLILSDILQSGKNELDLYSEIGQLIEKKNITRFIGIGSAIRKYADKFKIEKHFFQNTKEFLNQFSFSSFKNESILLKGARYFEFEQISKALQQQTHQTVLEINMDHMISNFNYFRSKLEKDTKVMLMVKAFSYGSGSYEIANLMQYHRADYLAVAYADEGVELRKAGISLPIMVMSPDEESMDSILKHDLEPEIYSFNILNALESCIQKAIHPKDKPVKIHIKLDTGMNRLGFEEKDLGALIKRIQMNNLLLPQSVFSHLAGSDNSELEEFSRQQFEKFNYLAAQIQQSCEQELLRHILNSAGITKFAEYQMDMVRLGLGLYGLSPFPEEEKNLKNINRLKTCITQIKTIQRGESVGYERAFIAEREMQVATVAIGYADGVHRFLGNGKFAMMVNEKPCPIIGNVCMDMCMLDVSDLDCQEGDEVIVFDNQKKIREMANIGQTIPYEILTGISQRVKRVYYKE
ncbi:MULTISPECIES: bifunctional UDP-N-acetylmuramoyl-tripeptide:D-alanyl-D-alanine ligase/alanine racemase [unclassified Lentimicrobium]|uniref:bifunctional UDP-N-acetylmuramoyl-tripeptide:D-alanyl-D-alanine ligase/alanine racemase n=1 Tax=unclassified Lentimicrobium TaxID=2677434 RepID=UPI001556DA95|nr:MULTISPECIES: bifunctional UDP-N-acetylmuramoyl-tripeptide:D-alanyl-D-alanine ligase/alanine racemase [unclassified Lentimicrobium]NPD45991.1 bifunctional UDP-N-acetylmuramoyl-tripeptide:D-alanyl-D-alanine ligase/alanine racemase [Lentimicrobium sp. S6]NPD86785.1 bifunctional UDP-N-acetylmuramoyl-tripeptide:D-alanyl-D-alanine ligase/alanine racemase [Lentimicrobium sp. L6]